jgi:hypothetical protein
MQFTIVPADTSIWNSKDLVKFLMDHQGQDIAISTNHEGCCCYSIGLYDLLDQFNFKTVTIHTPNPLEQHKKYHVNLQAPWLFFKVKHKIESTFHVWDTSKIFATIYGRPLWHRLGIAAHLLTYHNEKSLVGCLCDPHDSDKRGLFETNELFTHDPTSFQNFGNIISRLPLMLPEVDTYAPGQPFTDGYVNQTKQVYRHFLIDIVAETFTSGDCFFVTEKTIRPMLLKKPFIVMGSKDYLCYLRQMGFHTFNEFWSEDYDGYQGRERYLKILELIDTLSKKSLKELEYMYASMQFQLDHNYELLINQNYNTNITHII